MAIAPVPPRSPPLGVRQVERWSHTDVRFRASRRDPFGLGLAEAFGNSLADSVSFRFPSRPSLGGSPLLRPTSLTKAWLRYIHKVTVRRKTIMAKKRLPSKPIAAPSKPMKSDSRGKVKSDFPKHTLQDALRVAKTLEEKNGGRPLPPTEMAIALEMSPGSSDFRVILSSSIKYGLTSGSFNQERVSLTDLAKNIVEATSSQGSHDALVAAALNPATFRSIYEYFKGKKLPESTFFQNTVVREFEVPREHAEKCVNIFIAKMEQVGLVRVASTGKWLSTEAAPASNVTSSGIDEAEVEESSGQDVIPDSVLASSATAALSTVRNSIFLGHGKNKRPCCMEVR